MRRRVHSGGRSNRRAADGGPDSPASPARSTALRGYRRPPAARGQGTRAGPYTAPSLTAPADGSARLDDQAGGGEVTHREGTRRDREIERRRVAPAPAKFGVPGELQQVDIWGVGIPAGHPACIGGVRPAEGAVPVGGVPVEAAHRVKEE